MMNKKRNLFVLLAVMLCAALLQAVSVSAAAKGRWTAADGQDYYYTGSGKVLTGIQKIGKKYYYFDSQGVQQTGWQKINGNYYFFRNARRGKGCLVSGRRVNGIRLGRDGCAKVTSGNRDKLAMLVRANQIVRNITDSRMSRAEKLRAAFSYSQTIRYCTRGNWQRNGNWDAYYAALGFDTGRGDCFSYSCCFGYLANALGYSVKCISSGEHGWIEIDGKIYDPNFAMADKSHTYYAMDYGEKPVYIISRNYVKKI